jgi:hypothetical protein
MVIYYDNLYEIVIVELGDNLQKYILPTFDEKYILPFENFIDDSQ